METYGWRGNNSLTNWLYAEGYRFDFYQAVKIHFCTTVAFALFELVLHLALQPLLFPLQGKRNNRE